MASYSPAPIRFHYIDTAFPFTDRTRLKNFLVRLIKKEGQDLEALNYVFCTDAYLLVMNKQYLKHNTLTDIITFQLNSPAQPILSDIYISIDRVKDNAAGFGVPFREELHRVVFHGALHLCGYKDKSSAEKKEMRAKENAYLTSYFVPRGTKASKL